MSYIPTKYKEIWRTLLIPRPIHPIPSHPIHPSIHPQTSRAIHVLYTYEVWRKLKNPFDLPSTNPPHPTHPVFFFPRDTKSYPWQPLLKTLSRVSRVTFFSSVTGRNDSFLACHGLDFFFKPGKTVKFRGRFRRFCHGCHGLYLHQSVTGVTG